MVLDNLRNTIREVADVVGISFGSCPAIFPDALDMKRAAGKIVPKFVNFGHRSGDVDNVQQRSRFGVDF